MTNTVSLTHRRLELGDEDALVTIASTAQRARECYGSRSTSRRIWLLNKEVFALDALGRYREARDRVNLFFERFANAADSEHLGRFSLWRLLLYLYAGDFESAAASYLEARRYADALPLAQQAGLRNNGAVLAFRRERFEEAEQEATAGIILLDSTFQARDEALELAKLLQNRGHARLAAYEDDSTSLLLDPARHDLHASIILRDSLQITERQAEAHVTLGEIYHALGDSPAGRGSVGRGLALARDGDNARGEIFALWRMGRMNRRNGAPSLAREQLQRALDRSQESTIGEFKLFIQLELGRLFEEGQAWKRAEGFYRAVVETPDGVRYRSSLYNAAKARDEAERRRVAVRMHLAEADASRLRLALYGSVLLILLLGGAFAWQWRRMAHLERHQALLKNGTPEEDDLFERRMRYAGKVILRPVEATRLIENEGLAMLLLTSGLETRTQLYACVCALERALDGRVIPPEHMRRFLYRHFKKRAWAWPESVEGWQEHFREHSPDRL